MAQSFAGLVLSSLSGAAASAHSTDVWKRGGAEDDVRESVAGVSSGALALFARLNFDFFRLRMTFVEALRTNRTESERCPSPGLVLAFCILVFFKEGDGTPCSPGV